MPLPSKQARLALRRELRHLRRDREEPLTQLDVAIKINVAQSHYCYIENGMVEASPQERKDLARLFRVPVNSIPWVTVRRLLRSRMRGAA